MRDIATRARVNGAAISYHFGGKAALYRAVAASVAEQIGGEVAARLGDTLTHAPATPEAALRSLEALIETIVDVIVGPDEMRRVARFVIREQMQPGDGFEIIYGMVSGLHVAACRLFGAASGLDPEAEATRLRVFFLVGQVLFLRLAEAAVLRRLGMTRYDAAFLERAKRLLKANVNALVAAERTPT